MNVHNEFLADSAARRSFIGGSDARIIMGDDEITLIRLWREKRSEIEPENLSGNLIVQLGNVTEELNGEAQIRKETSKRHDLAPRAESSLKFALAHIRTRA